MHDEHDRLLEHDYDGIHEYDNPLPRWWVYIFVATIIFAAIYAINVGPVGIGKGRIADYENDMAAFRARHPQGGSAFDAAMLARLSKDPAALQAGKAVFTTNCAPCHRPDGGGLIGPNLTDKYWLHGGTLAEVYKTINEGVQAKGMPTWGKVLKPDQVADAAVYVLSLQGTNPANPKPPQGTLLP